MILQLGRSPEEGSGNPLQYCCLENSTDRGAQWALCSWRRKELDMTEQLTITDWVQDPPGTPKSTGVQIPQLTLIVARTHEFNCSHAAL